MNPRFLVTGATGTVGSEVVRQLSERGYETRALIHNFDKARMLQLSNVELVQGDLQQTQSLRRALKGIDAAFLLSAGDPRQVEMQTHFIDVAKQSGVKHLVKLSGFGASQDSAVQLLRWHYEIEQHLKSSQLNYTILRPGFFMQNFLAHADAIKTSGNLFGCAQEGKVAFVDSRDVAAVAAATMTHEGHGGKTYDITGPHPISFHDVAITIERAIQRPVRYIDLPPEAMLQMHLEMRLPEWLAEDLVGFGKLMAKGQAAKVTDVVSRVAFRQPTTFERFVNDCIWVFRI